MPLQALRGPALPTSWVRQGDRDRTGVWGDGGPCLSVDFSFRFPLLPLTHSREPANLRLFPLALQPCPLTLASGLPMACPQPAVSLCRSLSRPLLTPSHLRARG